MKPIVWPEGKRFAFTVFDDTDLSTVDNGPPVYRFLYEHGFRTTKSVWPLQGSDTPAVGGATCQDPHYLRWVYELREQGFEIALHNVTYHSSRRADILAGIEEYKRLFGTYPSIHVNHNDCGDSLYWGEARVSGLNRLFYNLLTRFKKRSFQGHVESSDFFWGDICKQKIKYVRNFVFPHINTLKVCPHIPYFDSHRPYVNYWFASAEGGDVRSFTRTISEQNQDSLEDEGGACIMYTHFGKSFYKHGQLNPRFAELMKRLSRKNGWFVPVSTLLDYLLSVHGHHTISARERHRLETKWLLGKILVGGTS